MALRHARWASPHNIFTGRRPGALLLRPKLARDGADGVIDSIPRHETLRASQWPSSKVAFLFGTRVAEPHLGSGHVRPRQQTGHMIAIASIRTLRQILQAGGRPHMGRGLHGRYPPSPVPVQGSTSRPGHNAGGLIPKPPGSRLQTRPRAPPSLPRRDVPPRHVLHRSEDCDVTATVTDVKWCRRNRYKKP